MTTQATIRDSARSVNVIRQDSVFHGAIWDVQRDTFKLTKDGELLTREYLTHPGAVAIVALDEQRRVAMIKQYRHPVGQDCWEIPAGLVDGDGETLLATAQRELAEEVDLTAEHWAVLVDHYPSGGSSAEAIRIYLAHDLTVVPKHQRHTRLAEEAEIQLQWVPLDDALAAVMTGAVKNVNAVAGLMAAHLVVTGQYLARPV